VTLLWVFGIIGVLVLIIIPAAVRIVWQYESGVHFRLGRLVGIKAPGVRFMIPFIDTLRKVDTRVVTLDVPAQEAITRDNVTLRVNAVVYFRVMHADQAVVNVADFRIATFQIAQTTLRSVLGKSSLDELLAEREKLNESLREIIDEATEPWGVKVSMVEVKDVELPDAMQRAMAAQAEAERERRAKIIHAEGEFQASKQLAEAAKIIGSQPATLQLRYLQTLTTIATERTNTVVFPLPLDILQAFTQSMGSKSKGSKSGD
jgi:regulator of protease activity HflC (stomatin/prohibitin superfamily)